MNNKRRKNEENHRGTQRKRVEQDSVKLRGKILLFSLFILHFSLFTSSCDLFNDSAQKDHLKKIDDEIAWANAKRLDVRVAYNPLWGSSPQQGALNRENTRKGYAFEVEFTPAPGYGFVGWFAFYTKDLNLTEIDTIDINEEALNGKDVNIVPDINAAGGELAKVTINITEPVTLVPLCSDRPRLSQRTNPPLNQTFMPFPYDQQINIWFNIPVNRNDLKLEINSITISGRYTGDKDGYSRGDFFGGSEDGDIKKYFELVFPQDRKVLYPDSSDEFYDRITLVPEEETAHDLAYLTVTVSVGTDITNKAGIPMDKAESFSFITDFSQTGKAYRANSIMVLAADGSQWFGDGQPFNNPTIDRRFLPGNSLLSKSFPVRFAVDTPGGVPPSRIKIIEQMIYDLDGSPITDDTDDYKDPDPDDYRDFIIERGIYILNHRIKTERSGIIRLLVLPWDDDIAPLKLNNAISEGRYVTIVVDGEAPDLPSPGVKISNHSKTENNETLYVYGAQRAKEGAIVTIESLGNIGDNTDGGGISAYEAWNYPWTKNEKLYWQVMIGEEEEEKTITSEWLAVYNGSDLNNQWEESGDITDLEHPDGFPVFVKYKDSPGNETGWINTGYKVKYRSDDVYPVTNLSAVCNTAGNLITVTWREPTESTRYENPAIVIKTYEAKANGDVATDEERHELAKGTVSHPIIPPTTITTGNVRNGVAVSGVYGYEITVITRNGLSGDEEASPIWVYNIPGMSVSDSNRLTRISTAAGLGAITGNLGGQYVLTGDITVSNHTPISTFTGKFYGNGHTVTINGINNSPANMGLFGIANNALIRDLTVACNATVTKSVTEDIFIGGITGQANNTTQISNCMVNGTLTATSLNKVHVGGIAGTMNPDALVENCRSGINLSVTVTNSGTTPGNGIICAGGIAGQIWNTQTVASTKRMIDKATAAGNVTATNNDINSTGSIYLGGIVGECRGRGLIQDTAVSGTLTMTAKSTNDTSTVSFNYICGGIIGRMQEGNIATANVTGTISVPSSNTHSKETLVGGIVGTAGNDRASSDKNGAKIAVTNATAQGNITYSTYNSGTVTVGGVCAASDGSASTIVFDNCEYRTSRIYVGSTNSILGNIGGFVGDSKNYTAFTNCRANANEIYIVFYPGTDTTKNITLNAGGFAGKATESGQKFDGLSSTSPVVVDIRNFRDADLRVGGFVGYHTIGSITKCFASGSVTVTSNHTNNTTGIQTGGFGGETNVPIDNSYATGNVTVNIGASRDAVLRTGGFTGYHNTGSINKCFARGSVTVNSSNTGTTYGIQTGGFAGEVRNNVSIDNSYALGTVKVDKKNAINSPGTINTGGFVGIMVGGTIQHSFSAGREIISLYGGIGDRWCRSGGFAGELANMSAVAVALCEYVHAKGANNSAAGRAVAFYGNCGLGFRAYDGMRVNANMSVNNTDLGNTVNSNGGDTHGINTSAATLATASFWTTTMGFNTTTDWDTAGLSATGRRYPLLRGLGGQ